MAAAESENSGDEENPTTAYSNEELTQLLFDLKIRYAANDKKLNSTQFNLEFFIRGQEATNKKLEEGMALLINANLKCTSSGPTDPGTDPPRWVIPPSIVIPPDGVDDGQTPTVKPEASRFDGINATEWIRKIQRHSNYYYTPLHDWVYLTSYLFDYPASSWLTFWEDNHSHISWEKKFLIAVKNRFDPDLFVDHVGCLAELRQTTSVEAYQSEFEDILQKTTAIDERP